jgi:F0F1-type ATP synthase assembly protein I
MADTPPSPDDGPAAEGPEKRSPGFADLFWLGTACAIAVVGGGAIGYGVDSALGTLPWFTFAGLAFGVVSAVLLAVNNLRKFL